MIDFRLTHHTIRPSVPVIEVWLDDRMVATITPSVTGRGFRVLSKYAISTEIELDSNRATPVNAISITVGPHA